MEDKIYYKLKSIEAEMNYILSLSRTDDFLETEEKKKDCKILLASIAVSTKKIQDNIGPLFVPEFFNG